jgi:alginate O-acetyltransferase complex protein AlgI
VTFTLIAYLVDVSTGKYPNPPSPRWLLGYTLFFPISSLAQFCGRTS